MDIIANEKGAHRALAALDAAIKAAVAAGAEGVLVFVQVATPSDGGYEGAVATNAFVADAEAAHRLSATAAEGHVFGSLRSSLASALMNALVPERVQAATGLDADGGEHG